eukprot:5865116-Alexandrium_andersonii.AAC.1
MPEGKQAADPGLLLQVATPQRSDTYASCAHTAGAHRLAASLSDGPGSGARKLPDAALRPAGYTQMASLDLEHVRAVLRQGAPQAALPFVKV